MTAMRRPKNRREFLEQLELVRRLCHPTLTVDEARGQASGVVFQGTADDAREEREELRGELRRMEEEPF